MSDIVGAAQVVIEPAGLAEFEAEVSRGVKSALGRLERDLNATAKAASSKLGAGAQPAAQPTTKDKPVLSDAEKRAILQLDAELRTLRRQITAAKSDIRRLGAGGADTEALDTLLRELALVEAQAADVGREFTKLRRAPFKQDAFAGAVEGLVKVETGIGGVTDKAQVLRRVLDQVAAEAASINTDIDLAAPEELTAFDVRLREVRQQITATAADLRKLGKLDVDPAITAELNRELLRTKVITEEIGREFSKGRRAGVIDVDALRRLQTNLEGVSDRLEENTSDARTFVRQLDQAADTARRLKAAMGGGAGGGGGGVAGFAAGFGKLAGAVGVGTLAADAFGGAIRGLGSVLAEGGRQIFDFYQESADAARDLTEATTKAQQVFGESFTEIDELARAAASGLGLAQRAALDEAANLGVLFKSAGASNEELTLLSKNFLLLAGDLTSFYNIAGGTEQALVAIRAGLVGEIEPLRRLGVQFSAAEVEARALKEGLYEQGQEIDTLSKVRTRALLILEKTAVVQGDFARTSANLANQQRQLAAEFENVEAAVGKALEPALISVVNSARELLPALQQVGTAGAGIVAKGLEGLIPVARGVSAGLDLLASDLNSLAGQIGPDFEEAGIRLAPVIRDFIGDIGSLLTGSAPAIEQLLDLAVELADGFADGLIYTAEQVLAFLDAAEPLINFATNAEAEYGLLTASLRGFGFVLQASASSMETLVIPALRSMASGVDFVAQSIGNVAGVIAAFFEGIESAAGTALGDLLGFSGEFQDVAGSIAGALRSTEKLGQGLDLSSWFQDFDLSHPVEEVERFESALAALDTALGYTDYDLQQFLNATEENVLVAGRLRDALAQVAKELDVSAIAADIAAQREEELKGAYEDQIAALEARQDELKASAETQRKVVEENIASLESEKEAINAAAEAQKDAINATIEALEAEQEALRDTETAQKKVIEDRLKVLQAERDALSDQVDAINELNEAQKAEIDRLQELEDAARATFDAFAKQASAFDVSEISEKVKKAQEETVAAIREMGLVADDFDLSPMVDEANASLADFTDAIETNLADSARFIGNINTLVVRGATELARFLLAQGQAGATALREAVLLDEAALAHREDIVRRQRQQNEGQLALLEGLTDELDGVDVPDFDPIPVPEAQLDALDAEIESLRSALDAVDFSPQIDALGSQIDLLRDELAAIDLDPAVEAIEYEISNYEAQIDSIDIEPAIDDLQRQIDQLEATAADISLTPDLGDFLQAQREVTERTRSFFDSIASLQEAGADNVAAFFAEIGISGADAAKQAADLLQADPAAIQRQEEMFRKAASAQRRFEEESQRRLLQLALSSELAARQIPEAVINALPPELVGQLLDDMISGAVSSRDALVTVLTEGLEEYRVVSGMIGAQIAGSLNVPPDTGAQALNSVSEALRGNTEVPAAAAELGEAAGSAYEEGLDLGGATSGEAAEAARILGGETGEIEPAAREAARVVSESFKVDLSAGIKGGVQAAVAAFDELRSNDDIGTAARNAGLAAGLRFAAGFDLALMLASNPGGESPEAVDDFAGRIADYINRSLVAVQVGITMGAGVVVGLREALGAASTAGGLATAGTEGFLRNIGAAVHTSGVAFATGEGLGSDVIAGFVYELDSASTATGIGPAAVDEFLSDATQAVKSSDTAFRMGRGLGDDLAIGFAVALTQSTASSGFVELAVRSFVQEVERIARDEAESDSPSKLFERFGEDLAAGVTGGLANGLSSVPGVFSDAFDGATATVGSLSAITGAASAGGTTAGPSSVVSVGSLTVVVEAPPTDNPEEFGRQAVEAARRAIQAEVFAS